MVDDHAPFLRVLRELLYATDHLEAAGEAYSGEQGVEMAQALRPDMALVDVRIPGLGGIASAKQIKARLPATLVALLSVTHPCELRSEAAESADAVIWKSELRPALLDALWLRHRDRT